MLQWNALYPVILELVSLGKKVAIETSGCVPIDADPYNRSFKYVMDIKCPSSGVSHKNIYENLMNLQRKDEVKFVISNKEDYDFMKKIIRSYPTSAKILVSPCFTPDFKPMIGKELVDWLIRDGLYNVRVQIQMHKCLGVR
jgi:7-carboxy-7-deazaguanine synthase